MTRGVLRIYLGAAPGVGKTFAMLDEGWRRYARGTDVVVGFVETHGRPKTAAQLRDLEVVARREIEYRGQNLEEMDLDAVLMRRPAVALVDELAHTNVPGSRNEKRWQDVSELLDAGIDVISTVNIQHLTSLNDVVEQITGIVQRETLPDDVVRSAAQIELVDMSPEALRRRMAHGNIYPPEKVDTALGHYFRIGNLAALRELALLWVANRVEGELQRYRREHQINQVWETKERVVVALTGAPGGEHLIRRAARMAARVDGELVGVNVRPADGVVRPATALEDQRRLLRELDGRYAEVTAVDIAGALVGFARAENATQLVLGASRLSRWTELVRGSVINRVARAAGDIDVHIISAAARGGGEDADDTLRLPPASSRRLASFPARQRAVAWVLSTVGIAAVALVMTPMRGSLGLPGALLVLLLGVVGIAMLGGIPPAALAVVVSFFVGDYFFVAPIHSFRINRWGDVVALIVFAAVAAIVGLLVDRLTRRGIQISRAQAEAESLARLAGDAVLSAAEPLPNLVAELRRTFDLDAVAILAPREQGWNVVAAAGDPVPGKPEDATLSAPLAGGTVLVLSGALLGPDDVRLLRSFVTQLRLAQERAELEATAATAVELAEANSLRGALLAAVSHDLRTPLASIKAAASSLLDDEVDWELSDARAFAKTIDAESDRLEHLVSNLLDLSRLQAGALRAACRPISLEDVVYDAEASLSGGSGRVVIDLDDDIPEVNADPGLLERAIANVVDNALAWSPADSVVRITAAADVTGVDLFVIDRGPGIPPDQRDRVFQAFQRAGDHHGGRPDGLGLGLAVARGFVEAIGGEITIADTPEGGATMVFHLRRAEL